MSPTSYQAALPRGTASLYQIGPPCQRFLKGRADSGIIRSYFLRPDQLPKENEREDLYRRPAPVGEELALFRPDGRLDRFRRRQGDRSRGRRQGPRPSPREAGRDLRAEEKDGGVDRVHRAPGPRRRRPETGVLQRTIPR